MTILFPLDTLAGSCPSSLRAAASSHRAQYRTTEDTDITHKSHSLSPLSSSPSRPSCPSCQIAPSPLCALRVLCGSSSICVHPRSSAVSLSASATRNRQSPAWAFFTASQFRPSLSPSRHYLQNPSFRKARKGPLFRPPVFLHSANRNCLLPLCPFWLIPSPSFLCLLSRSRPLCVHPLHPIAYPFSSSASLCVLSGSPISSLLSTFSLSSAVPPHLRLRSVPNPLDYSHTGSVSSLTWPATTGISLAHSRMVAKREKFAEGRLYLSCA